MLITDETFPKPRFWLHNSIQNFDEANTGKRICFLVWSCDSRGISQQIDFAVAQSADLILSEIYPHELPETTTFEQYSFFKNRFVFLEPETGVKLNKETNSNPNIINIIQQKKGTDHRFIKPLQVLSHSDNLNTYFIQDDQIDDTFEFQLQSDSLVIFISDLALKRAIIYAAEKSQFKIFLAKSETDKNFDFLCDSEGNSPIITSYNNSIRSDVTNILKANERKKIGRFVEFDKQNLSEIYEKNFLFEVPLHSNKKLNSSRHGWTLTRYLKNFFAHRILQNNGKIFPSDDLFLHNWFSELLNSTQNLYLETEILTFLKVAGQDYFLRLIQENVSKIKQSSLNLDYVCLVLAKDYYNGDYGEQNSSSIQFLKKILGTNQISKLINHKKHFIEVLNLHGKEREEIEGALSKILDQTESSILKNVIIRIYSLNLSLITFLEVFLKDKFKEHLNPKGFTEILKDKFAVKSIVEIYSLPDQSDGISSNLSLVFKSLGVKNLTNYIWQNAFLIKFAEYVDLFDFKGLNSNVAYSSLVGIFIKSKKSLSSLSNLKTVEDNLEKNEGFSELLDLVQSFQKGQFSNENKYSYWLHNFLCNDGSIESKFITELESNISRTDLDILKNC